MQYSKEYNLKNCNIFTDGGFKTLKDKSTLAAASVYIANNGKKWSKSIRNCTSSYNAETQAIIGALMWINTQKGRQQYQINSDSLNNLQCICQKIFITTFKIRNCFDKIKGNPNKDYFKRKTEKQIEQ